MVSAKIRVIICRNNTSVPMSEIFHKLLTSFASVLTLSSPILEAHKTINFIQCNCSFVELKILWTHYCLLY